MRTRKSKKEEAEADSAESDDTWEKSSDEGQEYVVSAAETSADDAAEEIESSAEVDVEDQVPQPMVSRAKAGSYVFMCNGYFTLTDHPDYPDCKLVVKPRWRTAGELGTKAMSKTVVCAHFGENKEQRRPVITYLVLRAWMCWRFRQNGFADKQIARRRWLQDELLSLETDVRQMAVSDCSTGSERADAMIEEWCPGILTSCAEKTK